MNTINGIKVVFFTANQRIYGLLTTEHAASSHGLPVFVGDQGEVLGSAEVSELLVLGRQGIPAGCAEDASGFCDVTDFYQRASQAGFRFLTN